MSCNSLGLSNYHHLRIAGLLDFRLLELILHHLLGILQRLRDNVFLLWGRFGIKLIWKKSWITTHIFDRVIDFFLECILTIR